METFNVCTEYLLDEEPNMKTRHRQSVPFKDKASGPHRPHPGRIPYSVQCLIVSTSIAGSGLAPCLGKWDVLFLALFGPLTLAALLTCRSLLVLLSHVLSRLFVHNINVWVFQGMYAACT